METKVQLAKLNNKNYFQWKYKMELLLIKEKVWQTVSKPVPSPVTEIWTQNDEIARALIGLNIEDNQIPHVRTTTSAKEAWIALKNIHEKDSIVNKITLMRQMYETKLEESQDLEPHFDKLTNLLQKLADLNENLSEHLKIALILSSLPKSWHMLVTALEVRKDEELTLSLVQSKLLDEDIRRRKYEDVTEEKVLKIRTNKFVKRQGTKEEKPQKSNVFCYFCKKRNHIMNDCYKFKEYCEKDKANLIATDDDKDEELLCITDYENHKILYGIELSDKDEWILDSGATCHISSNEKLFNQISPMENKKGQSGQWFQSRHTWKRILSNSNEK